MGQRDSPQPGIRLLAPQTGARPRPCLDAPVARALARLPSRGPITVLVNDPQRHTASRAVLTELTRHVGTGRLRVLIASGSHVTPVAARAGFEREVLGDLPVAAVAWHDSRADDLVSVGAAGSWRGHPWLLAAEGLFAIGSVEPHYFAGFTGAHKTATVGVAAHADIEANHAGALSPRCRPARLDGNPVAEGIFAMLADLERRRPVACVNLVQAGRAAIAAVGGAPREALAAAVADAEAAFVRRIDRPADAVLAEVTGPLGRSFYQADKGIKNCEWAVRDGGCIVLLAPCPAGIGQDHFVGLLREAQTHAAAAARVASRGYRLGDHKAVRLRYLTDPAARAVRVWIVSDGLSGEQADVLGLRKAASLGEALAAAAVRPDRDAVYHVRDAGNVAVLAGPAPWPPD